MDKEKIKTIKESVNIVNIISEYCKLEKRDNKFWSKCPFHKSAKINFCVNQDEQFFYCFSCKEGGDVIKFIMLIEKADFNNACKKILSINNEVLIKDLTKLKRAKKYMDELFKEKDPITGEKLDDQNILIRSEYKNCFLYISEILQNEIYKKELKLL